MNAKEAKEIASKMMQTHFEQSVSKITLLINDASKLGKYNVETKVPVHVYNKVNEYFTNLGYTIGFTYDIGDFSKTSDKESYYTSISWG